MFGNSQCPQSEKSSSELPWSQCDNPTRILAVGETGLNDGALAILSQTRDYAKPQAAARLILEIKDFRSSSMILEM